MRLDRETEIRRAADVERREALKAARRAQRRPRGGSTVGSGRLSSGRLSRGWKRAGNRPIARTAVVRELLRFALDHFASERGEEPVTIEPVSEAELAEASAALNGEAPRAPLSAVGRLTLISSVVAPVEPPAPAGFERTVPALIKRRGQMLGVRTTERGSDGI